MAALAINLTKFSNEGNRREYILDGDTALLPKRVVFTRGKADGNKTVQEYKYTIVHGAVDSVTSEALSEKITAEVKLRAPTKASAAAVAAVVTASWQILIADEYANSYPQLLWPID